MTIPMGRPAAWARKPRVVSVVVPLAVLLSALVSGCASNGYKKFYQPSNGATPEAIAALRAGPAPEAPTLERRGEPQDWSEFWKSYERRGFGHIGSSSFTTTGTFDAKAALAQGREVEADLVVLLPPKDRGTSTGAVTTFIPTTTSAVTNSNATAYGMGGTVSAFGSSRTTVYGSTPITTPVTYNHTGYFAAYFVKQKPRRLGYSVRELTPVERKQLGSNKGVVIEVVVGDSPFFRADVLEGDIMLAVNGAPVFGKEGADEAVSQALKGGGPIEFTLVRDGKELVKSVTPRPES